MAEVAFVEEEIRWWRGGLSSVDCPIHECACASDCDEDDGGRGGVVSSCGDGHGFSAGAEGGGDVVCC